MINWALDFLFQDGGKLLLTEMLTVLLQVAVPVADFTEFLPRPTMKLAPFTAEAKN